MEWTCKWIGRVNEWTKGEHTFCCCVREFRFELHCERLTANSDMETQKNCWRYFLWSSWDFLGFWILCIAKNDDWRMSGSFPQWFLCGWANGAKCSDFLLNVFAASGHSVNSRCMQTAMAAKTRSHDRVTVESVERSANAGVCSAKVLHSQPHLCFW